MGQQLKELEGYINDVIQNINDDRAVTSSLLTDLIIEIKKSPQPYDSHKELGQVAAKYVETLQRSNEQLVKIATLLHKKSSKAEDVSLSNKDKDELFDIIQGTG